MKKYEAYKDSNVEWLGSIPKAWDTKPIGALFSERHELSETGEEELLSISEYWGVKPRKEIMQDGEFVTRASSLVGYKKCQQGDIVSNIMLAWKGCLGIAPCDGLISPAYCAYIPSSRIDSNYYNYLFRSTACTSEFRRRSRGLIESRLRLYTPDFFRIQVPFPSKNEQSTIARYLDHKVSKIDTTIAALDPQIADLKTYRQSVISEAVTKGLDKNAPMKDSGIEWIGEIPVNWNCLPMKRHMTINNGKDYKDIQSEEGFPVIGSGGQFAYASTYLYDGEAVLLGRKGTIDRPMYINGKFWTVDTMFYATPDSYVNCRYIYYQALTIPFEKYSTNTALPSMTQTDLGNNPMCIPPLEEQNAIVDYLDTKISKVDSAIEALEKQKEDLATLKQSVISEAVTGKIDVRDWKPSNE